MTTFIALSGKKQVGKDLSANILHDIFKVKGKSVVLTAFAEPLKEMCIHVLGLKRENVYGTDKQKDELCHIQWDGFPMEVRLKYSNQNCYTGEYGSFVDVPESRRVKLPRSGPMSNREVLQVMGTDIFRSIYGDVWAKAPFNKQWSEDFVILTDCRFLNEKMATEENGGIIIRLERNTGLTDNHASETALDNVVFENSYLNDGTIHELELFLLKVLIDKNLV